MSDLDEARDQADRAKAAYDSALTELIEANKALHLIERRELVRRFNNREEYTLGYREEQATDIDLGEIA